MSLEPINAAPERYVFGNYEILDTLGKGGMGVVYRAHDRNLNRTVALKILRDDLRGEERVLARFRREAEAFARLDHPNIVHVHSVGAVENIPFIAMQFIDGETMAQRLRRNGVLDWREALRIGSEVAAALQCAHVAQVIHRDIKPGNILMTEEGAVYVTDFGIAKVLNATTQLTLDGSRLGTPQYMCPERCRNKPITPASDLYSLGVVLFQAITAKLPYAARTNVEMIERITGDNALRAQSLLPDLPDNVDRLLAWLLEKSPERRPASAQAVCEAIARVLDGKPIDAEADERDRALESYRKATPAKAARPPRKEPRTRELPPRARGERVAKRAWFGLPPVVRALALGVPILLLVGLVALFINSIALTPRAQVERLTTAESLARWDAPPALLSYTEERPGVFLAQVETPGMKLAGLLPAPTGEGVVLELRGPGTMALLLCDPATRAVRSLTPPRALPDTAALRVLSPNFEPLLGDAQETTLLGAAGEMITGTLPPTGAATLPYQRDGQWEAALAVSSSGDNGWQLAAYRGRSVGGQTALTPPGAPIVAAAAAADGSRFLVLRASNELWLNTPGGESQLIASGTGLAGA